MSCLFLPQPGQSNSFSKIRLVATDMDGTLTTKGRFTNTLLQALQDLAAADIKIIIVTGRSAGWVSGLAYYLPVVGAIAEN
ncbi:MAG: HAD hydrolase family protein, partial [Cyanobacteria bacterium P01_H01_bin.150]